MGWISQRAGRGNYVGGTKGLNMKDKGPLRKIVYTIHYSNDMFSPGYHELECGHKAHGWGQYKVRCPDCKKEADGKAHSKTA